VVELVPILLSKLELENADVKTMFVFQKKVLQQLVAIRQYFLPRETSVCPAFVTGIFTTLQGFPIGEESTEIKFTRI
jgi:hypothetical protein